MNEAHSLSNWIIENNLEPRFQGYMDKIDEIDELDLRHCGLNKLPKDFISLIKLKTLNLSNNNLSEDGIDYLGMLESLENLSLDNNPIKRLPYLDKLQNLKYLSLKGTNITSDSIEHIIKIINLTYLDISATNIIDISRFDKLSNLQTLIVGDTSFEYTIPIPTWLQSWKTKTNGNIKIFTKKKQ